MGYREVGAWGVADGIITYAEKRLIFACRPHHLSRDESLQGSLAEVKYQYQSSEERQNMIVQKIRTSVPPGTVIPKPHAKADFIVQGWGERRGEPALIYSIPNHTNPKKPYQKGITTSEFKKAYQELQKSGEFTRDWFNKYLPACAKEGSYNFTTIGGIFEVLDNAYLSSYKTSLNPFWMANAMSLQDIAKKYVL